MIDRQPSLPIRILKGFAMFWWDFLVGDTPEIFATIVITLGVVALLRIVLQWNGVAAIALPLLALGALTMSVRRARSVTRKK